MLRIVPRDGKRSYSLIEEIDGIDNNVIDLSLIAHSVSNKFSVVGDLISEMCTSINGFESWFSSLVKTYVSSNYNSEILVENADNFHSYAEQYIVTKNINFDNFVDLEKKSKTSIIFYAEDIRAISVSSTALKLYSFFSCDNQLKLPDNLHRKVYEVMIRECIDREVTTKIFQLIRSRTYRSSITDRYMWDFIRMMISETPESYVMTVFNFLMKSIVILIDVEMNPVPYIISTIEDSIRWLMRNVYKDKIVYGEIFGGTDDIFGSSLTKENFYLYCCQDVIGKAAKIGMDIIDNNDSVDETKYEKVREQLNSIGYMFPSALLITLPIASKVLEIPYKFLLTIPPKHAVLIGVFMHELCKGVLDERFPILTEFLMGSPRSENNVTFITKSSYKIRNLELVINDPNLLFGFSSRTLKFDVMSSIVGIISASKRNLVNLITNESLNKTTYYNLESDLCLFFSEMYSGKLDPIFEILKEKADNYF